MIDSRHVKILSRREMLPTPVFWPGEFHGLSSPWGCKESDTTEQLSLSLTTSTRFNSAISYLLVDAFPNCVSKVEAHLLHLVSASHDAYRCTMLYIILGLLVSSLMHHPSSHFKSVITQRKGTMASSPYSYNTAYQGIHNLVYT